MRAVLKFCCSILFVTLFGINSGTVLYFWGVLHLEEWLLQQALPQGEIAFVVYVSTVVFVVLTLGLGLVFHFYIFGKVKHPKSGVLIMAVLLGSLALIYSSFVNRGI